MRLISKILTISLVTVGGVGTLGGALMFGLAGGLPTYQTIDKSNPSDIKITTTGAGWLSYNNNAPKFINIENQLTYTQYLEAANTIVTKLGEKGVEELFKALQTEWTKARDAYQADKTDAKKLAFDEATAKFRNFETTIFANSMYLVSIVGIAIFGVSILISLIAFAIGKSVDKSEDKRKAKNAAKEA